MSEERSEDRIKEMGEKVIGLLWGMTKESGGLYDPDSGASNDRKELVNRLRELADTVENNPENVFGIVLSFGIRKGSTVYHHTATVGPTHGVAACHVRLKRRSEESIESVKADIIKAVMEHAIKRSGSRDESGEDKFSA